MPPIRDKERIVLVLFHLILTSSIFCSVPAERSSSLRPYTLPRPDGEYWFNHITQILPVPAPVLPPAECFCRDRRLLHSVPIVNRPVRPRRLYESQDTVPALTRETTMGPQQTSAPARLRGLYQLTRLHKFPLGSLIIYWPYGWSLAMAASSGHGSLDTLWKNVLILFIAATLYHSAFCVWNDICDRDLDVKVERTRNRPLVTGVVPVSDAYGMFIGLLILTFLAVSLTNRTAFAIMTTSLPINIIYPLAKRWTWWPQLLLGVACSWGCIVGWAAMAGSKLGLLETPALRALCVADTLFMVFADTMYAAQDKSDDDKAGIRSTARLFGAHIRTINALFALGFVSALAFAGRLNGNGIPYFLGCAGAALHAAWQLLMWRPDDAESSAAMFEQCHNLGYVVFLGIIVDIWI